MKRILQTLISKALLATLLLTLEGCGCGFDCSNDRQENAPALLSLGFSDESLEQLKQVVIELDSITLRRSGADDLVIDNFTVEQLGLVAADSLQIDLLQYRGRNQLSVIEGLELDASTYTAMLIGIRDGDVNLSYVQESDDSLKPINLAGSVLTLQGPALSPGAQMYTVVFSLAQALQYRDASDDYLLATDGVRVINNAVAASLSGRVERNLFDTAAPCDAKSDPQSGNRIYIYPGLNADSEPLADVFTDSSLTAAPANAVAPFAVAALLEDALTGGWQYAFGFLPAGDYTLAFSCGAQDDDPVEFDGIAIPLPDDQVYTVELPAGENLSCDLADGASCN